MYFPRSFVLIMKRNEIGNVDDADELSSNGSGVSCKSSGVKMTFEINAQLNLPTREKKKGTSKQKKLTNLKETGEMTTLDNVENPPEKRKRLAKYVKRFTFKNSKRQQPVTHNHPTLNTSLPLSKRRDLQNVSLTSISNKRKLTKRIAASKKFTNFEDTFKNDNYLLESPNIINRPSCSKDYRNPDGVDSELPCLPVTVVNTSALNLMERPVKEPGTGNYMKTSTATHNFEADIKDRTHHEKIPSIIPCTVEVKFSDCLFGENDLETVTYLIAYEELYDLCGTLGYIFKMIGPEVRNKIDRLYELQDMDTGNYGTLKKMLDFEYKHDLIDKPDFVSGCRAFSKLDRGINFLSLLLRELVPVSPNERASTAAFDVYRATVGKNHSWMVKKSVVMAMNLGLPTKQVLIETLCGTEYDVANNQLPSLADTLVEVHRRTDLILNKVIF